MNKALLLPLLPALMLTAVGSASAATPSVSGHRIVLDPGHGGSDPGSTQCVGLYEKDATLDITTRLKSLLVSQGAIVSMTREGDTNPGNTDRANVANAAHAEVFLSIHLNGSTNHAVDGTIGLWGKRGKDLDFTRAMHRRLPGELGVPDQGVTNFASGALLKANMPATIQESAYISNATECALLTNGTGARQQQIAQVLSEGLADWFTGK